MKRKAVLYVILTCLVVVGGGIGGYFWYEGQNYVSTEDSRLAGDIYKVMPRITGKVISLQVNEGDHVMADQIIGQQDSNNLPTSSLDQAALRSPIEGTVIKTLVKAGEVASPGQTVAMVVDKRQLYVTANIEETEIYKIHEGQRVDIRVDTFPGQPLTGHVKEISKATASTFSLLPSTNTSGNFTKVTQRIPVKISIDDQLGLDLSPGMSTTIKIHLKSN
ncbi:MULTISPECIES: HlyD family efflux transporter periplasmic adaptor subunit [Paenibacillus]|uniref:HlyD family secretion protein n=1 Tax=Paenibacillus naphthalenovorans TaxID=162209 RepID=A0A0U2VLM8_9BACL|nr:MULTISPECIES: HlyD family efflux transporter periplasmic adaptor subunit [Paenibacillus]ALS20423.1 HlyD family secretion protein [Paenibacillus naphthalenovorans]NTZ18137.1 HlyD family efflux transporter periplasmic adaptor subunit [Paenibacillus sp. JMULE4]SDI70722.1 HlyD family secretion protein [Paenibacillus naphthalenovorans]